MPTEPPDSSATSTQLPLAKLKELLTQDAFIRSLLIAGCRLARSRYRCSPTAWPSGLDYRKLIRITMMIA
jgi:hypothetical protein